LQARRASSRLGTEPDRRALRTVTLAGDARRHFVQRIPELIMTPVSPSNPLPSNGSGARIIGRATTTGGPGPDVMAATTLTGDNVLSSDGKEIGKVVDIMLDVGSGRIAYAVLSCGGFLGIGDKLFAVPWSAFTLDTGKKCFRLDVTEERMKSASGFDKDHWPAVADSQWSGALHSGNTPPM